jgi:hypothetical protein
MLAPAGKTACAPADLAPGLAEIVLVGTGRSGPGAGGGRWACLRPRRLVEVLGVLLELALARPGMRAGFACCGGPAARGRDAGLVRGVDAGGPGTLVVVARTTADDGRRLVREGR